ncbi:MAG: glycosyltransferase, partial [Chloroflexota bacterium]|nr:glycosyltransferase [Chloroflexota bacterium]
MRIGIYNRWLHTMGGGEREMGVLAEVLQADHAVDLITHQAADLDSFASRLNLHIPDVKLRTLPSDPEYQSVVATSAEYDLFFNMSHGDLFVPRARHNLLRVFFPGRSTDAGGDSVWAQHVPVSRGRDAFRRVLGRPGRPDGEVANAAPLMLESGFYQPEPGPDRLFAWTGRQARMLVTRGLPRWRLAGTPELQVILHAWRPDDVPPATVQLLANDMPIASRQLPREGRWTDWRVRLPVELARAETLDVTLETTTFNPRDLGIGDDHRDLGVALAAVRLIDGRWSAHNAARHGTGVPDLAAYEAMLLRRTRCSASAYDRLLANSRFTQHWIARRWELPSEVIYPPVDVERLVPGPKQPLILSVGRFFSGSHNKKHLPMIEAFRALCDAGLQGWEYHLVGGCDEAMAEQRAYLQQVRAAAQGYPIVLHVNAPFTELRALYGAVDLLFHATGFV